MHRDGTERGPGESAAAGAEHRTPLRDIDAHAEDGVDRRQAIRAGRFARLRDLDDVGSVRRELHDDGFVGRVLHSSGHLRRELRVGPEQHATLDVRARHVQLERDDAGRSIEGLDDEDVVVDAVARDVDDHGHAELRPDLPVLARDLLGAGILEADRIEDPRRGLGDPVLRVAGARTWCRALVHDRAESTDVDELGVLDALAERSGCGEHRVLEPETAGGLDREIDPVLRQRLGRRVRDRPHFGDHRTGQAFAQLVGDLRRQPFGVRLAGGGLRDRRPIEIDELHQVLFLLALGRVFERFLQRTAHVDRPLDLFLRPTPRH